MRTIIDKKIISARDCSKSLCRLFLKVLNLISISPIGKPWMGLRLSLSKDVLRSVPLCLSLVFLLVTAASCSEDDNTVDEYPDWQETNETYWNNLYTTTQSKVSGGDTSWRIIRNYSYEPTVEEANTNYIIANVLTTGTGTESPYYTDTVRIRYTGSLLPSTSYPNGYVFGTNNPDSLADNQAGVSDMALSTLVSGVQTALLHMHVGDKWMVYIPWTLGYGTTTSSTTNIPAYSVLRYNLELVAFSRNGTKLPDFKAKKH